jgi:chemotaxis protein CheX
MRTANTRSKRTVQFDPAWKSILECAALEVFEMMAGVRLTLVSDTSGAAQGEQTAMVGMAGALCGMMTIQCSKTTASGLASLMLGGDATSNPQAGNDAIGELCNMVAGNFKAKVTGLADQCLLSVPTVISGVDYSMETAEPTECVNVALSYDGAPVWVVLTVHT